VPTEAKPTALEDKTAGQIVPEKTEAPAPEAPTKMLTSLFDMLRGRNYPRKKY
jgi:hypothetical protein